MPFEQLNLHEPIHKALVACGYTKATPVQSRSIPEILKGCDVVVSAQTGSGKTAAFVLPALHHLSMQPASKSTRILILTPTRELAMQITKAISTYGKFMRMNVATLVGGMSYPAQIRELSRGADIIVATPGRLLDHIEQKRVNLSNIDMLILDEADRMLDMGFIDDVQYIAKLTPAKRQTLLFSATMDNKLMSVVRHILNNPTRIDLSNEKLTIPQIKQEMYKANNLQHKTRLLKHFLNDANIYKAIIFSATKINADKLAAQLRDEGFAAAALHGDLKQNVRNRTLDQLRNGKIQYLIATDVAARGIDISDITHVFNYDLPKFCEDYVHRIGRTGRAGKTGVAISFVLPTDTRHLQRIERFTGQRIKLINEIELPPLSAKETAQQLEENNARRNRDNRETHHHRRREDYAVRARDVKEADYPSRRRDSYKAKENPHTDRSERRFSKRNEAKDFSHRQEANASRKESKVMYDRSDKPVPINYQRPKKKFSANASKERREGSAHKTAAKEGGSPFKKSFKGRRFKNDGRKDRDTKASGSR